MGTRGYYCYRFRGRLYVYYNHWDSYPSVLGKFLIENIPTDPKEYQEWLCKLRTQYAELEQILDEKILTLPEPGSQPTYSTVQFDYGPRASASPLSAWQFHVDERLESLPSYSEEPSTCLFIEWIYTIDLDREVIHIKSGSVESSFELYSIPRQLQWAQDFEEEEEEDEDDEGSGNLAKDPIGKPFATLVRPAAPSEWLIGKYDLLNVARVTPKTPARPLCHGEHKYLVRELLFSHFIERWSRRLHNHILLCRSVDFIYREVLFAILSLASGDFKLLADQSPPLDTRRDLRARLGSPNGPNILPAFGSGVHVPDTAPGSAPYSSIYWFKGVLVLLADEFVDDDSLRAAIATVTEFGRESGHKVFDALVADIRRFALVRIRDTGVVEHTDLIDLVTYATFSKPGRESPDGSERYEESVSVSGNICGFNILMNFFEVVAKYTLKPFKPVAKVLPNELYDRIIEMVDFDTYARCSEVSETFRHYVQQHIRLSQQLNLTTIPTQEAQLTHHVIKGLSSTTSGLIMFDSVEGRDVESDLRPLSDGHVPPWWSPVIGHDKRQGMIVDCAITIPALASHPLPNVEDKRPEIDDPEFVSVMESGHRFELSFSLKHFYIPRFAGTRQVSTAWDSYQRNKLLTPTDGQFAVYWDVSLEAHRYLLPRNTEAICLEPMPIKSHLGPGEVRYRELAGMIWLKKPADLDEPLVRQRTLREAQDFLNSQAIEEAEKRRAMRQGLLIIAFGTKAQCYNWNFSDDLADVQPLTTPLQDAAVFDIAIKDQRERFEELFMSFRNKTEAELVEVDLTESQEEDAPPVSMT